MESYFILESHHGGLVMGLAWTGACTHLLIIPLGSRT